MTDTQLASGPAEKTAADILVIAVDTTGEECRPLLADELLLGGHNQNLEEALGALNSAGKIASPTLVPSPSGFAAPLLLITPVADSADPESLRRAIGAAVLRSGTTKQVAVCATSSSDQDLRAICEGATLGAYRFNEFRSEATAAHLPAPERVTVLVSGSISNQQVTLADKAFATTEAVSVARDLVNTPPNEMFPAALANYAKTYLSDSDVSVKILTPSGLKKGKYGGLLAVGQGSQHGPRLVRLKYTPDDAQGHVALVGKGITFDSGGLSLKPAKSMETMKSDMAGAAAVLATVRAAADLALPIAITGWLAVAENMPSGSAQRPGDVITIRGGKTVEVLNTDAEGRLVLADAIARAGQDLPDVIVDVATLTGAQAVALGPHICGVMSNDTNLREELVSAATNSGEGAWPMPLPAELRASLNSPIADLANIGDRNGGMLSAGLFLAEFVDPETGWAHLDIAGPAWNSGSPHGYTPRGGTGFAVRTLVQFLDGRCSDSA